MQVIGGKGIDQDQQDAAEAFYAVKQQINVLVWEVQKKLEAIRNLVQANLRSLDRPDGPLRGHSSDYLKDLCLKTDEFDGALHSDESYWTSDFVKKSATSQRKIVENNFDYASSGKEPILFDHDTIAYEDGVTGEAKKVGYKYGTTGSHYESTGLQQNSSSNEQSEENRAKVLDSRILGLESSAAARLKTAADDLDFVTKDTNND